MTFVADDGRVREETHLSPSPFIVGAGRSGTTLLRLMLDSHPEMAIPPETHFIPAAVKACELVDASRRKQMRIAQRRQRMQDSQTEQQTRPSRREHVSLSRQTFVDILTSWRTWNDHGVRRKELREKVSAIRPFNVSRGLRAFYELYAEKSGKPRWGDKTPPYMQSIQLIQNVLPEARFIHLIRDGRDVALSIKDLWFGPNSVKEAAEWWQFRILEARSQAEKLLHSHYMEVRYEDLVSKTEPTLKKVCAFVDLPWAPSMLQYHVNVDERIREIDRDVVFPDGRMVYAQERRAIFSLANKPPQRNRVDRWRREMKDADRTRFEAIAGDLLKELGYEVGERAEDSIR